MNRQRRINRLQLEMEANVQASGIILVTITVASFLVELELHSFNATSEEAAL
jgi:hypothetical protein